MNGSLTAKERDRIEEDSRERECGPNEKRLPQQPEQEHTLAMVLGMLAACQFVSGPDGAGKSNKRLKETG
jgi:hypothetical protein